MEIDNKQELDRHLFRQIIEYNSETHLYFSYTWFVVCILKNDNDTSVKNPTKVDAFSKYIHNGHFLLFQ